MFYRKICKIKYGLQPMKEMQATGGQNNFFRFVHTCFKKLSIIKILISEGKNNSVIATSAIMLGEKCKCLYNNVFLFSYYIQLSTI